MEANSKGEVAGEGPEVGEKSCQGGRDVRPHSHHHPDCELSKLTWNLCVLRGQLLSDM